MSSEASPIIVEESANLVLVTFYQGASTDEYEAHIAEMDRVMAERPRTGRRWCVLVDATRWVESSPSHRKLQIAWQRRHEETMRRHVAGTAFVIESAMVRGGLTAVLWVSPLPCPHTVVKRVDDALAWCSQQLGEEVELPG